MPKTYHQLSKRRKNQLILFHISQLNKIKSNVLKKCFKTNSNVEMICNYSNSESTFSNETNTFLSNSTLDSSNNILNLSMNNQSMNNYSFSTSNSFDISVASDQGNSSSSNFFFY